MKCPSWKKPCDWIIKQNDLCVLSAVTSLIVSKPIIIIKVFS